MATYLPQNGLGGLLNSTFDPAAIFAATGARMDAAQLEASPAVERMQSEANKIEVESWWSRALGDPEAFGAAGRASILAPFMPWKSMDDLMEGPVELPEPRQIELAKERLGDSAADLNKVLGEAASEMGPIAVLELLGEAGVTLDPALKDIVDTLLTTPDEQRAVDPAPLRAELEALLTAPDPDMDRAEHAARVAELKALIAEAEQRPGAIGGIGADKLGTRLDDALTAYKEGKEMVAGTRPRPRFTQLQSILFSVEQGAFDVGHSLIRQADLTVAIAMDAHKAARGGGDFNAGLDGTPGVAKFLDALDEAFAVMAPSDDARAKDFVTELAHGSGSMIGFLATRAAGIPVAVAGSAVQGVAGYEDARARDARAGQVLMSWMLNSGLGVSEAVPIDRFFRSASMDLGEDVLIQLIIDSTASGVEEFIQESAQTLGEDLIAKYGLGGALGEWTDGYDPERDISAAEVLRAGMIGGITGFGASMAIGAGGVQEDGGPPPPQTTPEEAAAVVDEVWRSGLEQIDEIVAPGTPAVDGTPAPRNDEEAGSPEGLSAQVADLIADDVASYAPGEFDPLVVPEEKAGKNLRAQVASDEVRAGTRTAGNRWTPQERVVLEAPGTDLPPVAVGDITFDDWTTKIDGLASDEDIAGWASWYGDTTNIVAERLDVGHDMAARLVAGFLVANQQNSPSGSFLEAIVQAEEIGKGASDADIRSAGLKKVALATRRILRGEAIDAQFSIKIADFYDSAMGRETRRWMGDDPAGGAPFVIDRHSARDMGATSDAYLKMLAARGYQIPEGLRIDIKQQKAKNGRAVEGSISDGIYNNRASFGRDLTAHLNETGWHGRSDWTPAEVQAVGWMATLRLTGQKAEDMAASISRNEAEIAYEVVPTTSTPWAKEWGPRLQALPDTAQRQITSRIAAAARKVAFRHSRALSSSPVYVGSGGWENTVNPSAITRVVASRESMEETAMMLGLLLDQDAVFGARSTPYTDSAKTVSIDLVFQSGMSRNATLAAFDAMQASGLVNKAGESVFPGFMPIIYPDGREGIRLVAGETKAQVKQIQAWLNGGFADALGADLVESLDTYIHQADAIYVENDWTKGTNGYADPLSEISGPDTVAELLRAREALHADLETAIENAEDAHGRNEFAAQRGRDPGELSLAVSDSEYPHGSAEQIATDTPAFKAWFGDSAVVDENGDPLVVYHGTQAEFDAFDISRQGESLEKDDVGIFFSSDIREAEKYSRHDFGRPNPKPRVVEGYLAFQNPLMVDTSNPHHRENHPGVWYDYYGAQMARYAKQSGYDSLIISDFGTGDSPPPGVTFSGKHTVYVAFDPTQIKSVYNRGGFDPENPDILAAAGRPIGSSAAREPYAGELTRPGEGSAEQIATDTPAFKAWFGDSAVVDENGAPLVVYHGSDTARQDAEGFAFETGRPGKRGVMFTDYDVESQGVFFSPAEADAGSYGGSVGAYYVAIRNPLKDPLSLPLSSRSTDEEKAASAQAWADALYVFAPVVAPTVDATGAEDGGWSIDIDNGVSVVDGFGEEDLLRVLFQGGLPEWSWFDNPEVVARMRELGYDGAAVAEPNDESGMSWFAIDPTQIKSVYNRGGFDPTNPDILAAAGRPIGSSAAREPYAGELTRPGAGVAATPASDAAAPISLADIGDRFQKLMGILAKQGRFTLRGKEIMGQYNRQTGSVRLRSLKDVSTMFHEAGHDIHSRHDGALSPMVQRNDAELEKAVREMYDGDTLNMDKANRIREGFAELFRNYVGNRAAIEQDYPGWTRDMDRFLDQHAPDVKRGIGVISGMVQAWSGQSSVNQVRGQVVTGKPDPWMTATIAEFNDKGFPATVHRYFRETTKMTIDRALPLRELEARLMRRAAAQGQLPDIKVADDPAKRFDMLRNSGAAAMQNFYHGVEGYRSNERISRSLQDALFISQGVGPSEKGIGKIDEARGRDFATFVIALRARAEIKLGRINRLPIDATEGDIDQVIADMTAKYGDSFTEAAKIVDGYGRALWKKRFDAGLLSREVYEAGLEREFYVPLQRDMSDRGGKVGQALSQAAGATGMPLLHQFRGSDRDVIDPMNALMMQTFATEAAIAHNDIKVLLAQMIDRSGRTADIAERVPSHQFEMNKVTLKEIARQLAGVEAIDEADAADMVALMQPYMEQDAFIQQFTQTAVSTRGEPMTFFWEDGKLKAMQIIDQELAADVIGLLDVVGIEQMNDTFMSTLAAGQVLVRQAITRWPDFIIRNFIRDQLQAWIATDVGYVPFVSGLKGGFDEVMGKEAAALYNAKGGLFGGVGVAQLDGARYNRDIAALKGKGYIAKMGARGKLSGLLHVTEISETATRIGLMEAAYNRAKKENLTDYEAAMEATYMATDYMNYGLHGTKTNIIRRIVPFLNAQLVGLHKMHRVLLASEVARRVGRKNALQFMVASYVKSSNDMPLTRLERQAVDTGRKAWTKMSILATLTGVLTSLFWDDEDWQQRGEYIAETYWYIPTGNGKAITIPKPFEWALLSNAVERGIEALQGDERAMERFRRGAIRQTMPMVDNPVVTAIAEHQANHSFYRDRELIPFWIQAEAAYDPATAITPYTSQLAKDIGGAFGWKPILVDHYKDAMLATAGRDISTLYEQVANPNASSLTLYDAPILRGSVRSTHRGSVLSQDFWDLMGQTSGRYTGAAGAYDNWLNGADPNIQQKIENMPEEERYFAFLSEHFEAKHKRLHPLRRAQDITRVTSTLRKELISPLGVADTGGYSILGSIALTPKQKSLLASELSSLAMREQRNAMIMMGEPGWRDKDPVDPNDTLTVIRAISPDLADELDRRVVKAKVYPFAAVQELWPEARERLLLDGPDAYLDDLSNYAETW